MRFSLANVSPRKQRLKSGAAHDLLQEYVRRAARYAPTEVAFFDTEALLLASVARASARTAPHLVLLDSTGKALTSRAFAEHVRSVQSAGVQQMVLAIGPADGWSAEALAQASLVFSLGAVTLAHELALVVAAEQLYRALTILAGHPYHSGH
jgi:23S rRNA (pseudouridine1915-N3)-methyltransferase